MAKTSDKSAWQWIEERYCFFSSSLRFSSESDCITMRYSPKCQRFKTRPIARFLHDWVERSHACALFSKASRMSREHSPPCLEGSSFFK